MKRILTLFSAAVLIAAPALGRDSLGVYADWGAFRDPNVPRCYAIAKAAPSTLERDQQPFASIGTWPKRKVRGQVHLRLSRNLGGNPKLALKIGDKTFAITGAGANAWATDRTMDAAIVAAIRSARTMVISATDNRGRRFSNIYALEGAATAMDAATLACAKL